MPRSVIRSLLQVEDMFLPIEGLFFIAGRGQNLDKVRNRRLDRMVRDFILCVDVDGNTHAVSLGVALIRLV